FNIVGAVSVFYPEACLAFRDCEDYQTVNLGSGWTCQMLDEACACTYDVSDSNYLTGTWSRVSTSSLEIDDGSPNPFDYCIEDDTMVLVADLELYLSSLPVEYRFRLDRLPTAPNAAP
ncbi:MAG: hypothetical protein KJO07_01275, partial [Deltaproteobacteria bacterium]|nr:hypothetical protein [Deltaproteobacteria bacterium]